MQSSIFFQTSADVIVVGGGVAGLSAILEADGLDVAVVHPDSDRGSSALARGGIAAALDGDEEGHVRDTCTAGAGMCDRRRVKLLVREGRQRVAELVQLGMPFDRDERGELSFGLEAGHSRPRILHADGDATGRALVRFLVGQVAQRENVRRVVATVRDLLIDDDGRVAGVSVVDSRGLNGVIRAPHVVLATGGIGALFSRTSNGPTALGDGLALAARAGAWLVDLEFVQFHPTALDVRADTLPLITEALRGAGARLVTGDGELIMVGVHPDRDLAPRDVVAREVTYRQSAGDRIFLDTSRVSNLEDRFPSVVAACRTAGVATSSIPIAPAAHYHMGGIEVDDHGRTSVEGLWACGEVAGTGVHGANRLASNSLLEALVFGRRVGCALTGERRSRRSRVRPPRTCRPGDASLLRTLRRLCWETLGVERSASRLWRAAEWLDVMSILTPPQSETGRRILVVRLLVEAAFRRMESRGGHFRIDHPRKVPAFLRRTRLSWSPEGPAIALGQLEPTESPDRPDQATLSVTTSSRPTTTPGSPNTSICKEGNLDLKTPAYCSRST